MVVEAVEMAKAKRLEIDERDRRRSRGAGR